MIKVQNVKMIDVWDWDKLVEETYGRTYSFQQQDGCKDRGTYELTIPSKWADNEDNEMHDSVPEVINGEEMGVKFKTWLERDPKQPLNPTDEELKNNNYYWGDSKEAEEKYKNDIGHINMFYERNFYPRIEVVANDLYEKGLIEAGDYTIKIDW